MKAICSEKTIVIPDGVSVEANARHVRVKGPRGTLVRDFKHIRAEISLKTAESQKKLTVKMWFSGRKDLALIRTLTSHIENMMTGVTKGFRYKMRFVYAHFPINATIGDSNNFLEIRNFMGEKAVRRVAMKDGVQVFRSEKVKDQIELEGNSVEDVSMMCSQIHGCTLVRNKDIRKFLDGVYVSEKGHV